MVLVNKEFKKAQEILKEVKEDRNWYSVDLQFFAGEEGGGSDDAGSDDAGGQKDDPEAGQGDNANKDEKPDEGGSGDLGDKGTNNKTFSQDDVNAIAAREAKKAQEKILKQLGVKDAKSAKDALDQFNKMQEDAKTDAQKLADRAKTLETDYNNASQQVQSLTAQLAAVKAGVNTDSLEDVIILANKLVSDDVTIDDAIGQVVTKYPQFKAQSKPEGKDKKPKFSDGDHKADPKPSDMEKWASAFSFGKVTN